MNWRLIRLARRYEAMRAFITKLRDANPPEELGRILDPGQLDRLLFEVPPIAEGNPTTPDDLPQCALVWNSRTMSAIATGVLVAPDLVLTAAHVQVDVHPDFVSLGIAESSQAPGAAIPVRPCRITPDPWGIALLRLQTPSNLPPVTPVTTAEFNALHAQGGPVKLYGFGLGESAAGTPLPAGVKRYLDNVPILPDASAAPQIPNFDPAVMFAVGAIGGSAPYAVACSGDSGGPAIAMIGGNPKLAGIIQSTGAGMQGSLPGECGLATIAALSRADQRLNC
jgi:hypothetical protein